LPSPDRIPDEQLLDAAYLPAAPGLDPAVVLYGPVDLAPGAWRRAETALDIPDSARRLSIPMGDPETPRFTATRALAVHEAIPFLAQLATKNVRQSVRAWALASLVAQRLHEGVMPPRGTESTDAALGKLAAALPPAAHAALVELAEGDEELGGIATAPGTELRFGQLTATEALNGFLDVAQHLYALGFTGRELPTRRPSSRSLSRISLRLIEPMRREAPWGMEVDLNADAGEDTLQKVLDQAAGVFAAIGRWSMNAPAERVELTADEASALILQVPTLRELGATVQLPESLTRGLDDSVSASLRFRDARAGGGGKGSGGGTPASQRRFRLADLVGYDLSVALGGQQVSPAELRKLAADARGLVHVGTSWVALTEHTREQLEQLARTVESRDANMANSAALAASLSGTAVLPGGIEATVEAVDAEELRRALNYLREPGNFEAVDPDTRVYTGELRPYQLAGLRWLAGMDSLPLGAVLADDMGLGKTVQVIALLTELKARAEAAAAEGVAPTEPAADGVDPAREPDVLPGDKVRARRGGAAPEDDAEPPPMRALIVCPTSLIGNWQRELERFAPGLTVHVHHGPTRRTRASQLQGEEVVVTSYGLIARDRDMLSALGWDIAIFDEAQSVKTADTEQARAARLLRARSRVALTGTPMENRLLELWAILDLVNPGLLGRAAEFNRRYAAPIERGGDDEAAARLRAITRPFLLRRVKHDPAIVPDLPEKQEHTVWCTLTPEQAALYKATADAALAEVKEREGIGRRGAVLALLTRLKQICNHPAQATGETDGELAGRSGKLDRLTAMLEEVVDEGDRALVFTQYAQMGERLQRHLSETLDADILYLHGGVPRAQREELIAKFQEADEEGKPPRPMIFILSLKAGGLGLNLMNAAHVFHFDRWWNPAVEDQATDRTHRIGQTRNIQVHKLVCAGTLEERIASIIEDKRALAGRVIEVSGTGEGWVTELTNDELEELVSLSAGAVVE
jgi:hypothetical protein